MKAIHIAGTCDTKGEEIAYLRDLIVAEGLRAVVVDLGSKEIPVLTKLSCNVLPILALSLAAGCVEQPDGGDDTFVFGLTADEVLAAKRVAQTDLTDAAWLDAHRGEFDCGRYGTLCHDGLSEAAHRRTLQPQSLAIAGDPTAPRMERQKLVVTMPRLNITDPISCQKEQGHKINDKIPAIAVL